jgi:hypothetical protein
MKTILSEDIKRISSIMYGDKTLILEKFSKDISNFFNQNGFVLGVFPYTGYYSNQFFKPIKSTYANSKDLNHFGFFLGIENNEGDSPDSYLGKWMSLENNANVRAIVMAKDPLLNPPLYISQKTPTNWDTYVYLSKWNFNEEYVNMVTKKFPSLTISNCVGDPKQSFCLRGSLSKEQVVQVANYLEEKNWTGLDVANPQSENVT